MCLFEYQSDHFGLKYSFSKDTLIKMCVLGGRREGETSVPLILLWEIKGMTRQRKRERAFPQHEIQNELLISFLFVFLEVV